MKTLIKVFKMSLNGKHKLEGRQMWARGVPQVKAYE